MNTTLILGGPGTGKTEKLLSIVDDEIASGVAPSDVAFVSFTNKAVNEARDRAVKKFSLNERNFPYFQTIHSLCYRQLGLQKSQVVKLSHLREIGSVLDLKFSGKNSPAEEGMTRGDQMLFMDNLSRSSDEPLRKIWEKNENWEISWFELFRFSQTFARYKEERGLMDFSDMLRNFADQGADIGVSSAIIDEAQDLTFVQWRVVEVAFSRCERVYIAGDDDQAIYEWAGADVKRFLHLGEDHREVLSKSYRLPRKIFDRAELLSKKISDRYEKSWEPRETEGSVEFVEEPDLSASGTWYLLSRNICFLKRFEEMCRGQGVSYTMRGGYSSVDPEKVEEIKKYERARRTTGSKGLVSSLPIWHEAEIGLSADERAYYVTILRKGGSLTKPSRVHIDTIHGVKGGEADHVALMVDLTRATEEACRRNPDPELRTFYVGATRARESLHVVYPETERFFSVMI